MHTDWIPFELTPVGNRTMVRWVHAGAQRRFLEPFFNQSIKALLKENLPQKLTPLAALAQIPAINPPSGFIFHVSRCGSTLISRSLAEVARHRIISEAYIVNQLLLTPDIDQADKGPLLKGLLHALCASAPGSRSIFKFTSWNLFFLPHIQALFPTTPWLFVYREPADVIDSLLLKPPRWKNNQELARLIEHPDPDGPASLAYWLKCLFEAPLPHVNRLARPFNYAQLPHTILDMTAHFGLELSAGEQEHIRRMGQYDAKQSGKIAFVARVPLPLPDQLKPAMSGLNQLYEQWEQIRIQPPQRIELNVCLDQTIAAD